MIRKVLLAVSGGVDSAVAGYLLKTKGLAVIGAYMKNWDEVEEFGSCKGNSDFQDAQFICDKIGIPLIQIDLVKQYWSVVFNDFLQDYENGLTPNPDILCNRYIKFSEFFNYAMNFLKVDAIATGHYARTSFGSYLENYNEEKDVKLYQAFDDFKDQTFFLCQVQQNALRRTMFPIGSYLKIEIKNIAESLGLTKIAKKRESTGICFVGNRDFQSFISEYIEPKPGNFIDVDTEQIVGTHNGLHCWTLGQRCRISGCVKPYFVAKKCADNNAIYVAAGTNHPALFTKKIIVAEPVWIRNFSYIPPFFECQFRFQHTKPLIKCLVRRHESGLHLNLEKSVRSVTPGQYAVLYWNNECLGGARIL